jgi:hypothetical protein
MASQAKEWGLGPSLEDLQEEHEHHLFPLRNRAKGRQQCNHVPDQVCVESELEVNPAKMAMVVLLCREDVGGKVVPVEEPARPEDVQDHKD